MGLPGIEPGTYGLGNRLRGLILLVPVDFVYDIVYDIPVFPRRGRRVCRYGSRGGVMCR